MRNRRKFGVGAKRRRSRNNVGGNPRQQLLDGSSVFLPLTHTAVPTRGSITGTFTRATTSTWPNNDGYLVTGVAGEIGFVGARRVRNLLTFTEDFSNAVWAETGLTKTATTLTEQATGADHSVRYTVASGKNVFQIKVKPNGRTRCALASTGSTLKSAIFNLTTASVEGALTDAFTTLGDTPTITLQSDGYYLLTMGNLSGSSTLVDFYMLDETSTVRSYVGDITKGMFLKQAQLEDVTAQTTQTAGEYVSVGVPSDWAGDELVTNGTFDTDLSGWTLTQTVTAGVPTWDAGSMKMNSDGSGFSRADQKLTTVAGAKYVVSGSLSGNVPQQLSVGTTQGGTTLLSTNIVVTGIFSYEFTATGTESWVRIQDGGGTANSFDNISVKPAYYHGSFVDGVACFDYYYLD